MLSFIQFVLQIAYQVWTNSRKTQEEKDLADRVLLAIYELTKAVYKSQRSEQEIARALSALTDELRQFRLPNNVTRFPNPTPDPDNRAA